MFSVCIAMSHCIVVQYVVLNDSCLIENKENRRHLHFMMDLQLVSILTSPSLFLVISPLSLLLGSSLVLSIVTL